MQASSQRIRKRIEKEEKEKEEGEEKEEKDEEKKNNISTIVLHKLNHSSRPIPSRLYD